MIIGLTGGIGSGKTTVARYFSSLGVPIYIADDEAKALMLNSTTIKTELIALFGDETYINGALNKAFISKNIFNDKTLLNRMNAIVHPEVAKHFKTWVDRQNFNYVIKESAILFESNAYKDCDKVITVTAPKSIRKQRVIERDNKTNEDVEAIIKNQWTDTMRIKHADYVIENLTLKRTYQQVECLHKKLLELGRTS